MEVASLIFLPNDSFLESIVNLTSLYLTGFMRVISDNMVVILST